MATPRRNIALILCVLPFSAVAEPPPQVAELFRPGGPLAGMQNPFERPAMPQSAPAIPQQVAASDAPAVPAQPPKAEQAGQPPEQAVTKYVPPTPVAAPRAAVQQQNTVVVIAEPAIAPVIPMSATQWNYTSQNADRMLGNSGLSQRAAPAFLYPRRLSANPPSGKSVIEAVGKSYELGVEPGKIVFEAARQSNGEFSEWTARVGSVFGRDAR